MSITPLDHPFLAKLFDGSKVLPLFDAKTDIFHMLQFEVALAEVEAEVGLISAHDAVEIAQAFPEFTPDMKQLAAAVARDGVVVPELLNQMRQHLSEKVSEQLHLGATSQDVIDSSLMMRCTTVLQIMQQQLSQICAALRQFDEYLGGREISARTRMQRALPISLGQRVAIWHVPLHALLGEVEQKLTEKLPLSMSGAVGDRRQLGAHADQIVTRLAEKLNLRPVPTWHTDRREIISLGQVASNIANACGKIGIDVGLMTQNELAELKFSGGGGSSAMPHKHNPINAEILVSLARFNATQMGGLAQAGLHEQERSGAAWGLEWMILPQMLVAASASLTKTEKLITQLTPNRAH